MTNQIDTSYEAYQRYFANMIEQNKPNVLDYDEWVEAITAPTPAEFMPTIEEISYEQAERLGAIWATPTELKEMGLDEEIGNE